MSNAKRVMPYTFAARGTAVDSYVQRFEIPKDAEVLSFVFTGTELCLWVLEEDEKEKVGRLFQVIGTYTKIYEKNLNYIGSASIDLFGNRVMHCFEVFPE